MLNNYQRIKYQYENSQRDSTNLFCEIIKVADEIGMDDALACLERCVIEKRLAWLKTNPGKVKKTDQPLWDGYRLFYEKYLGVFVPEDGEIVAHSNEKIVTRWWNSCPTLEACVKLGLDTREICKKAYQKPVQEFLMQINPKLRFERNYKRIRPYAAYCEEIIYFEEK